MHINNETTKKGKIGVLYLDIAPDIGTIQPTKIESVIV